MNLPRNLEDVRARISAACARAGRDPSGVQLVAVTKSVGTEAVRELMRLGQRDLGENRVQDAMPKIASLGEGPRWHFIGGLQRNKVRKVLGAFQVVHAIDSLALAHDVARIALETGWRGQVFVQVNVAREPQKGGVAPEEAGEILAALKGMEVLGLMGMAPRVGDARPSFRQLRALRDSLGLKQLSMGMSQDFEAAVEEGASLVRVGTALFR